MFVGCTKDEAGNVEQLNISFADYELTLEVQQVCKEYFLKHLTDAGLLLALGQRIPINKEA